MSNICLLPWVWGNDLAEFESASIMGRWFNNIKYLEQPQQHLLDAVRFKLGLQHLERKRDKVQAWLASVVSPLQTNCDGACVCLCACTGQHSCANKQVLAPVCLCKFMLTAMCQTDRTYSDWASCGQRSRDSAVQHVKTRLNKKQMAVEENDGKSLKEGGRRGRIQLLVWGCLHINFILHLHICCFLSFFVTFQAGFLWHSLSPTAGRRPQDLRFYTEG